jgi:hypothetical protein
MESQYVWYTPTISLSKVSNMTSEKKTKQKASGRKLSTRERAAAGQPAVLALEKRPEVPAWREQAAFHVTLDRQGEAAGATTWQTHAYHEETGEERVLPGVLDQDVIGWMRERAGLPTTTGEPVSTGSPEDTTTSTNMAAGEVPAATNLELAVSALEVIEQPAERQVGGGTRVRKPHARVTFDLGGPVAYLATAEMTACSVQVTALNLQSAVSALLASSRQALRPELLSYEQTLELEVPEVGSYQLIANVVLPEHGVAAVGFGPVLRVVP